MCVFIYVSVNLLILMFINIKFKIHIFYKPKCFFFFEGNKPKCLSKYINQYFLKKRKKKKRSTLTNI